MLSAAPTMRGLFLTAVLVMTGCATTTPPTTVTTLPVQRIAFTSLPTAATAIQGSGGVSLGASTLAGTPTLARSDGAVSFPMFQPDLGALVKVGKSSYLGGHVALSSSNFGVALPAGLSPPSNQAMAFDLSVGGGADFRFTDLLGLSVAGEFGIAGSSVTRYPRDRAPEHDLHAFPTGRATVGFLVTPGKFRIYAGATAGAMVSNDATGVRTETCQLGCSVSETGRVGITFVTMAGVGVRWQANDLFSLALEAWVPFSPLLRSPPVISLTVRLGDFGNSPPAPRPLPPPPPPPDFTPEPEGSPPQL